MSAHVSPLLPPGSEAEIRPEPGPPALETASAPQPAPAPANDPGTTAGYRPIPSGARPPSQAPDAAFNPAHPPNPSRPPARAPRAQRRPNRDWRQIAELVAAGHHPIVVANIVDCPALVVQRQLRRSRRLRRWIEDIRRANANDIGWRLQALRNELAESLREGVKKGDRLLVRWLAQELGLAHVPGVDPAGTVPDPKDRTLAGRYEPAAVAAARAAAEAPPPEPKKEEAGGTIVLGSWDENGNWIDPCKRDHYRQIWYGPAAAR